MIWYPSFPTFMDHYSVDEEFDEMTTFAIPFVEELTYLDESYPGMSELETMTLVDMYSDFVDPLVDWWTLSDNEKQQLAEAYWLQYLDDTDTAQEFA